MAYGTQRSLRRGQGAEIAGSRPYRPGDRLAWIDWSASARISLARDDDLFVVREYYSELAPRVIVIVDRRPSMGLYPAGFPYLCKPEVIREATTAIVAAAHAARAYVGYLDVSGGGKNHSEGSPHWIPPHRQSVSRILHRLQQEYAAPADSLEVAIDYLLGLPSDAPAGSFVFVLSDFLTPLSPHALSRARSRGWDLVPVIVQDPTWESTFPSVQGLLVPVRDPASGKTASLRLTAREVSDRRVANETRFQSLVGGLRRLQLDPVVLQESEPAAIDLAFIEWATRRRVVRGKPA